MYVTAVDRLADPVDDFVDPFRQGPQERYIVVVI